MPKHKKEELEAFWRGKNINVLTKTLSDYQVDSNCNFLVSKRESFLENNNSNNNTETISSNHNENNNNKHDGPNVGLRDDELNLMIGNLQPENDDVISLPYAGPLNIQNYDENITLIREILGSEQSEDFLRFVLKEKLNNLEDAMNCLTDDYDMNEMQTKFFCQESKINEEILAQAKSNQQQQINQETSKPLDQQQKEEGADSSLAEVLSSREEFLDLLFNVLEVNSLSDVRDSVWNIIASLPVSKQQRQALAELCSAPSYEIGWAQWDSFLNIPNSHVVLYRLQMIAQLIRPSSTQADGSQEDALGKLSKKFRVEFLQAHGFSYIYDRIIGNVNLEGQIRLQPKVTACQFSILQTYLEVYFATQAPQLSDIQHKEQDISMKLEPQNQTTLQPPSPFFGPANNPNISNHVLTDEEMARNSCQIQGANQMQTTEMNIEGSQHNHNNNSGIQELVHELKQNEDLLAILESKVIHPDLTLKCLEIIDAASHLLLCQPEPYIEELLAQALYATKSSILLIPQNIEVLLSADRIQQVISFQLFISPCLRIRQKTKEFLEDLALAFEKSKDQKIQASSPREFFMTMLLRNLEKYVVDPSVSRCDEYLLTLIFFIFNSKEIASRNLASLNLKELFSLVIKLIDERPIIETRSQNNQDRVLGALLKLAQELILREKELSCLDKNLTKNLMDYLFYMPNSDMDVQDFVELPKCKHRETRKAALGLALLMCSYSPENFELVFKNVKNNQTHLQATEQDADINIKPSHGFVGLKNLGCTCYINSLLQQFYMIKQFRNALLNTPIPAPIQADSQSSLDIVQQIYKDNTAYQLQLLFAQMQCTIKQYLVPISVIESIKGFDGAAINVRVQEDVNEFFNRITDKIEEDLKGTQEKTLLQELIGGQLSNEIISLEEDLPFLAETVEPFLTITVDIQKCKNIFEALDAQVKGDALEGENMYFCSKYDKKIRAQKRSCIKTLPNTLVLTLKRFDFDYNTMERKKINDYFEFPLNLNLRPWAKQNLFEIEGRSLSEADIHPENYYAYNLAGVLVHNGTAESGHYYSFIKNRDDDKWYEFNDSNVREFKVENLPEECYGGKSSYQGSSRNNGLWEECDFNKSKNAYILFYERVQAIPHQFAELAMRDIPTDLMQRIKAENREFWQSRFIFDTDYFSFVQDLLFAYPFPQNIPVTRNLSFSLLQLQQLAWMKENSIQIQMQEIDKDCSELNENDFEVHQDIPKEETIEYLMDQPCVQVVLFALQALLENQDKQKNSLNICEALKRFQEILEKNTAMCFWFLDIYLPNRKTLIVNMLLDQYNYEIRDRFEKLLLTSFTKVLQVENPYIQEKYYFKRIKDTNSSIPQIETIGEITSCALRFLQLLLIDLFNNLMNHFNRASNYLNFIKEIIQKDCSIILFMNESLLTRNYMTRLTAFIKRQLSNNQYQDQDVTNNSRTLSKIVTEIIIKSCTKGMIQFNFASPVYREACEQFHQHVNLTLDPEIEQIVLQNFSEFLQICVYLDDPFKILAHIAWGNRSISIQLMQQLRDFICDFSFETNQSEVAYRLATEQIELNDGLSQQRMNVLFSVSEIYRQERVLHKMEVKSRFNETMSLLFIKWLCNYSTKNANFRTLIISEQLERDTKWIKPFLVNLNQDKGFMHTFFPVELAKEVFSLYKETLEKAIHQKELEQQQLQQQQQQQSSLEEEKGEAAAAQANEEEKTNKQEIIQETSEHMEEDKLKGEVENAQPIQEVKHENAEPQSNQDETQRQQDLA